MTKGRAGTHRSFGRPLSEVPQLAGRLPSTRSYFAQHVHPTEARGTRMSRRPLIGRSGRSATGEPAP